jgi:hypothetical protein
MSIIHKIRIIGLIGLLFSCAKENQTEQEIKIEILDKLKEEQEVLLKENIRLVGDVLSFDFMIGGGWVISSSSPSSVISFDSNGNQIFVFGNIGQGPYEFMRPDLVRVEEDTVYIWCGMSLKLIAFSVEGTPLFEYKNIGYAIQDFRVYKDHAYIYSSGNTQAALVQEYDLKKGLFTGKEYGKKSDEHQVLSSFYCASGMDKKGKYLYFTSASELGVFQLDMEAGEYSYFPIDEVDFQIKPLDEHYRSFMENPKKSIDYVLNSPIITGLFIYGDGLMLTIEEGEVEVEGLIPKNYISKRRKKYYKLETEMNISNGWEVKLQEEHNHCLYMSNSVHLFYLKQGSYRGGMEYGMYKIIFPS